MVLQSTQHQEARVVSLKIGRVVAFMTIKDQKTISTN
ncbi:hypothetical protein FOXB_05056 [Fusarium oxysporum f. sp. conglutinans Fo5176]|uniref:Uncharacterized protein n=1 Tax=Fusarium oxysporum (strain Fo5176) TaxID=660025 RepID=F9FF77_FUSOF|nr:hypothetical protein FOXB_05056 [Fusarium oxysporum f. sp. conglutinans Fo5176]